MIPSTGARRVHYAPFIVLIITLIAPPFAMTRWVAQTRQNYVSVTPYNISETMIHGFQGTHQPAIWMGMSLMV